MIYILLCCTLPMFAALEELKSTFRIEHDVLLSAEGKEYHPYPFSSPFHSDLAYALKDLKQAEVIHNAYNKHIHPIYPNGEALSAFQKAVLDICLLFGNPMAAPEKAFLSALSCQGIEGKKWIKHHSPEILDFLQEANQPIYPQLIPNQNGNYTIALITTTCSGGNLSISNALTEFLRGQPGINIIEIDTEEVAQQTDPVKIATQSLTYDGIYSAIFQQTNDFTVLTERKQLRRTIHRYIPSDFLRALKQRVLEIKPDLILSVRSYTSDDIALSTLGIPFRMMNVDFELCSSLNAYYKSAPTNCVRFWLQHSQASMFKPLFQACGHLDLYNSKDTPQQIASKLAPVLHTTPEEFLQQFEVIGYPISPIFHPIKDDKVQDHLRTKWGVAPKEIPVFVMMGKHSTAASKEIFSILLSSETPLPIKYLFICGKNSALKRECEEILASYPSSIADRFHILGLLTPEEINEVMNISALGITKAGASTTIEIMATETSALLFQSYPWEQINGNLLVEIGYARHYNPQKPLILQIEQCLQIPSKKTTIDITQWQNQLQQRIPPQI